MIKHLKKIFNSGNDKEHLVNEDKKLQLATCALLVEMANADEDFTDEERKKIISIMKETFELDHEYVEELLELSEEKAKNSISIYEFSSEINDKFSSREKYELMKNLWRIIFIDDKLDAYEDRLVKRIGATMHLEHQTIIAAKLEVKKEIYPD